MQKVVARPTRVSISKAVVDKMTNAERLALCNTRGVPRRIHDLAWQRYVQDAVVEEDLALFLRFYPE